MQTNLRAELIINKMAAQKNLNTLKELGIDAEHIELKTEAHSVAEVKAFLPENYNNITEDAIVKTLVMVLDDVTKIILLPGNKKIDFKKLKDTSKAEIMGMAEYSDVEKIGTVGALFAFDINASVFIDQSLIIKEKIIINIGTLKDYALISGKELEKIKNAVIGDFI